MTTYEKIKQLCKDNGLTIARLERTLGFGNGSIAKHKGKNMQNDRLVKIATFFDISIDYLLDDDISSSPTIKKPTIEAVFDPKNKNKKKDYDISQIEDFNNANERKETGKLKTTDMKLLTGIDAVRNNMTMYEMWRRYEQADENTQKIILYALGMAEGIIDGNIKPEK